MWTVPESNRPHGLLVHLTAVSAHDIHNRPCAVLFTELKTAKTNRAHFNVFIEGIRK